jgi:XTP/dITP diphosphohydrolase
MIRAFPPAWVSNIEMKSKLLLATNNRGKVLEYHALLGGTGYELVTPVQQGFKIEVEESGSTYEENARLKALPYARTSGLLTLADDSGLEGDALGGEPGIRSSRYAGENATDKDRVNFLLARLRNVPEAERTACFRCVIALARPDGKVDLCYGRCDGIIIAEPRGNEGFGYDPIFYFPELKKTMAELHPEIKNQISHRARAAQKVRELLQT